MDDKEQVQFSRDYYFGRTLKLFDQGWTPEQISKIIGRTVSEVEEFIKIREKATSFQPK